eukprot:1149167-Pelagomonas_calceolata.AAC.2
MNCALAMPSLRESDVCSGAPATHPYPKLTPCSTVVGLKVKDGVVMVSCGADEHAMQLYCAAAHLLHLSIDSVAIASHPAHGVEKLIVSKLLVEGSNRRIFNVDRHAGMAVGGLAPDGRVIVNRAMDEASNYKRGDLILRRSRVYGVSLAICGPVEEF